MRIPRDLTRRIRRQTLLAPSLVSSSASLEPRSSFATIIAFASQSRPRHPRHWIKGTPPPFTRNERSCEGTGTNGCRGGNSIMAFSLRIYAIQISSSRKLLDIHFSSVQSLSIFLSSLLWTLKNIVPFQFLSRDNERFSLFVRGNENEINL